MTINSMEAFIAGLWDWSCLDGCFGQTRIRPTDVDGLIECNRHFLFLEAKPPNGHLTQGQHIALTNLSRQPNTTCIVIYGDPTTTNINRIVMIINGTETFIEEPSLTTLRAIVASWYQIARQQS